MRNLTTYALALDLAYGATIQDVVVIGKNGIRKAATLKKRGDQIDLETVDIPMFCRSVYCGLIQQMLMRGTLIAVPQKVAVALGSRFDDAINKLIQSGGHPTGFSDERPEIVMIGPGSQVAVGRVPEVPLPEVVAPKPLNNGAYRAPTVLEAGLQVPPELEPGADELIIGEKKPGAPKPEPEPQIIEQGLAAGGRSGYANWKLNLAFGDQKTTVLDSVDPNFLEWVQSSDDSKQLQKLAAQRLQDLGEKVTRVPAATGMGPTEGKQS